MEYFFSKHCYFLKYFGTRPCLIDQCKIFIGSIVTELATQEPWIIDQPRNALAPGPPGKYTDMLDRMGKI